jgi:hypothetical protein
VQQILATLSHALTNSYILFKVSYATMIDHFDTEEDFNKFSVKYRAEMAKLVRLASSVTFDVCLRDAHDWSLTILARTGQLDPADQSGFDPNSFLYLCWDALIVLWSNLVATLNRKLAAAQEHVPVEAVRGQLVHLLSSAVQANIRNPNYCSFNLSLISCILTKTSDLYDESSKEMMLKTIVDKLLNEFVAFQNESAQLHGGSPAHAKFYFNLRRQITAVLLNICKSFPRTLVRAFDYFYTRFMGLINLANSTQMEKSILIQGLVYLSNELGSSSLQLSLIKQFVVPILEFFRANTFHLANIDSFVKFVGMDAAAAAAAASMMNRKLIFFYVNCLFGILKCVSFIGDGPGVSSLAAVSHEQSGMFIQLFEFLVQLLKAFNLLHTEACRQLVPNREQLLDMTDSAKQMILGMQQVERHAGNSNSADTADNPEKIGKFFFFFFLFKEF